MSELPIDEKPLPEADETHSWVVVHCRPRCEKKAERLCRREGITCYLPLRTKVSQYGSRQREFSSPLFNGYLFAYVDVSQKVFLRQDQYVARIIETVQQHLLYTQLCMLKAALDAEQIVEVCSFIQPGRWVRIGGGPMKGLEAQVAELHGTTHVLVSIEMIQQTVAMKIEAKLLEPVH